MAKTMKTQVQKEDTLDKLEIRLGRIVSIEKTIGTHKKSYKLIIDFGKFGKKISVGRFTNHSENEIKNQLVLGVLNFNSVTIGETDSEVLILGVQFPKAESGEATFITPVNKNAKIGGKVF